MENFKPNSWESKLLEIADAVNASDKKHEYYEYINETLGKCQKLCKFFLNNFLFYSFKFIFNNLIKIQII